MAGNVYEGMFILDSNRYARDPGGVSGEVQQIIEGAGGKLMASRLWEERRLAYPIEGHRKGAYWLTYFELEGAEVSGINRQCQINESILRHLILKVDPKLVEPLVAHANAAPAPAAPKETIKVGPRVDLDVDDELDEDGEEEGDDDA